MRRLRISAISYLNTAPLMWDFEHGDAGASSNFLHSAFGLRSRSGSRDRRHRNHSSRRLRANSRPDDIAWRRDRLSPAGAFDPAGQPSAGRQDSLRGSGHLFDDLGRTDQNSVRKMAGWRQDVHSDGAGSSTKMLAQHDAGLVIGDPALQIDRSRYFTLDLAEEWIRHTGKPFVFAFWAVRQQALQEEVSSGKHAREQDAQCGDDLRGDGPCGDGRTRLSSARSDATAHDLATIFQQSRDHGLEPASLDHIAREWAPRLGISEADVRSYLTRKHLLLPRRALPRRPATFLSLRG